VVYDTLIIGGGPAGLTAAIYASRFKLSAIVIAKDRGGLLQLVHKIENWPGEKSISGIDLMNKMIDHVKHFDVPVEDDEVVSIEKPENFIVKTKQGKEYEAKTIIVATGTQRRKLGVPGEKEFFGRGVSYCATCDAPFFKDKNVGVVGGSDASAVEALMIAEHAKKVYIIYRKAEIRAEPITKEKIANTKNIEIITNTNVTEIKGDKMVTSVMFDNGKEFPLDGLFIEIGGTPISMLVEKLGAKLNEKGEIITDDSSKTNINGLFAAGDVTDCTYKQAIVASAEAAMAAFSAFKFKMEQKS